MCVCVCVCVFRVRASLGDWPGCLEGGVCVCVCMRVFRVCVCVVCGRMCICADTRVLASCSEQGTTHRGVTDNPPTLHSGGRCDIHTHPRTHILRTFYLVPIRFDASKFSPACTVAKHVHVVVTPRFPACPEKCGPLQLSLAPVGRAEDRQLAQSVDGPKGATFTFSDVMPGKYKGTGRTGAWVRGACARPHTCAHTRTETRLHAHTHTHTQTHTPYSECFRRSGVHAYTDSRTHIQIDVHTHAHTYTCTHTHTHTTSLHSEPAA